MILPAANQSGLEDPSLCCQSRAGWHYSMRKADPSAARLQTVSRPRTASVQNLPVPRLLRQKQSFACVPCFLSTIYRIWSAIECLAAHRNVPNQLPPLYTRLGALCKLPAWLRTERRKATGCIRVRGESRIRINLRSTNEFEILRYPTSVRI